MAVDPDVLKKLKNRRSAQLASLTKRINSAQALLHDDPETVTPEDAEDQAVKLEQTLKNFEDSNTLYLDAVEEDEECQKIIDTFAENEEKGLRSVFDLRHLKRSLRQQQIKKETPSSPQTKTKGSSQDTETVDQQQLDDDTKKPLHANDQILVDDTTQQPANQTSSLSIPPSPGTVPPSGNGSNTTQSPPRRALDAWIDDLDSSCETKITAASDIAMTQNEVIIRALFQKDEPDIEVLDYDGSALQWPRFVQSFYEGVHSLPFLTDTKRMTLLQNHLTGTAKNLTEGLGYSGRSYARAMKDLKLNFGHRSLVARAYIDRITKGAALQDRNRKSLRDFHIAIRDCLLTLQEMCYNADIESSETIRQATRRLPSHLIGRWAEHCLNLRERHREPSLSDLEQWLGKRVMALFDPLLPDDDAPQSSDSYNKAQNHVSAATKSRGASAPALPTASFKAAVSSDSKMPAADTKPKIKCPVCTQAHIVHRCETFEKMNPTQRIEKVIGSHLCLNCLADDHAVRFCTSNNRCRELNCNRKHHTKLHDDHRLRRDKAQPNRDQSDTEGDKESENATFGAKTTIENKCKSNVYLQIVPVRIHGADNRSVSTYALLDGACQSSFIKKSFADKLNLSGPEKPIDITTLLSSGTINSDLVSFKISSLEDETSFDIPWAWTLDELHTPPQEIRNSTKKLQHLADLNLADIHPDDVGIVIGANLPEAILATEIRKGPPGRPLGVKTPLGWTIMGVADSSQKRGKITTSANITNVARSESDDLLHLLVESFFKTESVVSIFKGKPALSVEDKRAQQTLDEKTKLVNNHYQVPMLYKDEDPEITADGYYVSLKRWTVLEEKFRANPEFFQRYKTVITDLLLKKCSRKMTAEEAKKKTKKTRYLPHGPVINPNKPEKLRVVKDAASKAKGKSLNDFLVTGPDLLNCLVGILLRFKRGSVGIAADIEAMFHRVLACVEDRDCLRFLWKDDLDAAEPDVYQMNVHIFGAKCSPTCAEYALQRTAKDNQKDFSELAVNTVLRDFYVDDLISGESSPELAAKLANELIDLCKRGGFRLTKWTSNSREVLASLPPSELAAKEVNLELDELPVERVLGMHWNTDRDQFIFRMIQKEAPSTKRGALTIVSSVFDPLGYEAPFILRAKLIIQQLWRLKIDWDEQMPEPILSQWLQWLTELPEIANFAVPRRYAPDFNLFEAKRLEVHTFADASEVAMGVVSYLRITSPDDVISCSFLKANTNCAPLKPMGPARLETQACVLAVRQQDLIRSEIDLKVDRYVLWSDSMTAIQYINNETRRFHVYIANRITEIHESTDPSQWYHCPGLQNPADDCSRGLAASDINLKHRFLHGPDFLYQEEKHWPHPVCLQPISEEDVEVRKEVQFAFAAKTVPLETIYAINLHKYSRLIRLTRTTAYVMRLPHNMKCKLGNTQRPYLEYRTGPLKPFEIELALLHWVKQAQLDGFRDEKETLKLGKCLKPTSSLLRLLPVIDEDMLRVGGRIDKAPIAYDARHQLVIPEKHYLAKLLVIDAHEKIAHSGQEHVLAKLRERFWIINARVLVRNLVRSCIICHRRRIKPALPVMAELPAYRVDICVPCFTNTGVDYFGPMYVKIGRASVKRYGCLFCCLVTRAIHLEVAVSLDTDDFICALRRFTCRRGVPKILTSDNGTNFRGADRELRDCIEAMKHDEIATRLATEDQIEWKFNPPSGPHFGGVWERLVRSVKTNIRVVIGNKSLRDDVLYTSLVEIESIVNSRPLSPVSDDPDDYEAITPSHFLIGRSSPRIPPDVPALDDVSPRKRWRQAQTNSERFWELYRKHYLPELTPRQKWNYPARNLVENDLVLIVDEQVPRGRWLLGRVLNTRPDKQGVVRSAEIKTSTGTLIRPVAKLCLLEGAKDTSEKTAIP